MLVRAGVVVVWWVGFLMGGVMYQNKIRDRGCAVRRCSGDRPRGGGRREREREGVGAGAGRGAGRGGGFLSPASKGPGDGVPANAGAGEIQGGLVLGRGEVRRRTRAGRKRCAATGTEGRRGGAGGGEGFGLPGGVRSKDWPAGAGCLAGRPRCADAQRRGWGEMKGARLAGWRKK